MATPKACMFQHRVPREPQKKGHTMKAPATTKVLRHLRPGSPKAEQMRVVGDVRKRGEKGMKPDESRKPLRCAVYREHSEISYFPINIYIFIEIGWHGVSLKYVHMLGFITEQTTTGNGPAASSDSPVAGCWVRRPPLPS